MELETAGTDLDLSNNAFYTCAESHRSKAVSLSDSKAMQSITLMIG